MSDYFGEIFNAPEPVADADPRAAQLNAALLKSEEFAKMATNQGLTAQQAVTNPAPFGSVTSAPDQNAGIGEMPTALPGPQDLANEQVVNEGKQAIAGPLPPAVKQQTLNGLAGQYDNPAAATPTAARAAVVNRQAQAEPSPGRAALLTTTRAQLEDEQRRNVAYAIHSWQAPIDEWNAQSTAESKSTGGAIATWATNAASKIGITLSPTDKDSVTKSYTNLYQDTKDLLHFVGDQVPTSTITAGRVLSENVPSFSWGDFIKNPDKYREMVTDTIKNGDPATAKKLVDGIVTSMRQYVGGLTDSNYVHIRVLSDWLAGLEPADAHAKDTGGVPLISQSGLQQREQSRIQTYNATAGSPDLDPNVASAGSPLALGLIAMGSGRHILHDLSSSKFDTWSQIAQAADVPLLAGKAALGAAARGAAGKALWQEIKMGAAKQDLFTVVPRPGTVASDISQTTAGATRLLEAATAPNPDVAAKALGTTPGQIVGDLVLPKPKMTPITTAAGDTVWTQKGVSASPNFVDHTAAPAAVEAAPAVDATATAGAGLREVKAAIDPAPLGKPMIEGAWLPETAQVRQIQDNLNNAKAMFTNKLNDHLVDLTFDRTKDTQSWDRVVRVGNAHGVGFDTPEEAFRLGDAAFGDASKEYNVVKDQSGAYQVEFRQSVPWLVSPKDKWEAPVLRAPILTTVLGAHGIAITKRLRPVVGKSAMYVEEFAHGAEVADLATEKERAYLQSVAEPFMSLKGDSLGRVKGALDKAELDGIELRGNHEYREQYGLSKEEWDGVQANRNAYNRMWQIVNDNNRARWMREGWKQAKIGGDTHFVKEADAVTQASLMHNPQAIDMATGQRISSRGLVNGEYKVYQTMADDGSEELAHVLKNKDSVTLDHLPMQVVKDVPGYQKRYYTSPVFVRELLPQGGTKAYKTAASERDALREIADLGSQYPDRKFESFHANKRADQAGTYSELEQLRNDGLLATSKRRPTPLTDVNGGHALLDPQRALDRAINSSALQAGKGRWYDAIKNMWDNTYGHKFNITMDLAHEPTGTRAVADADAFSEAHVLYDYVRTCMGMHEGQGWWVRRGRNWASDIFYNGASKLRDSSVPLSSYAANTSQWFGDHISGMKPGVMSALKNTAFLAHIGTNPLVQFPMQLMNMVNYSGVDHAMPYMMNGKFQRDFMGLLFHGGQLDSDAKKLLGFSDKEWMELGGHYSQSGLPAVMDNHLMLANIYSASKGGFVGGSPGLMAAARMVTNTMTKIGFELPIHMDSMAAWLVMRNRGIARGLNMADPNVLQKIATDAIHLTGGMTSMDRLVDSQAEMGMMSAVLQFASWGMKMAQRSVSVVTRANEAGLSSREQARLAVMTTLQWGAGGYGLSEFVNQFRDKSKQWGWDVPEKVWDTVKEGVNGIVINHMLHAWDNPNQTQRQDPDKLMGQSKTAVSEQWGPYYQDGIVVNSLYHIMRGLAYGQLPQLESLMGEPASFGMLGDMAHGFSAIKDLLMLNHIPVSDRLLVAAQDVLKMSPLYSDLVKARLAQRYSVMTTPDGNMTTEAKTGDLIASIMGMHNERELGTRELSQIVYGKSEGGDEVPGEEWGTALKAEADHQWDRWMHQMLLNISQDTPTVDPIKGSQQLNTWFQFMKGGLTDHEAEWMHSYLMHKIDEAQFLEDDKLVRTVYNRIDHQQHGNNNPVPDQSLRTRIMQTEDFKGKSGLQGSIESWFQHTQTPEK